MRRIITPHPMDIAAARSIALKDFDGDEYDHFGKAAYRIKPKKVGGKPGRTFMTLWIEEGFAVLMLDLEQQTALIAHHPGPFEPHPSKLGQKGATIAHLGRLSEKVFRAALELAYAKAMA
ncbi:MAG TPA: hypothetical protein PLB89_11470 [Flavobacteriales bacterium]|nr:hypothetical protein [Flavobacteriales bacterium]